MSSYSYGVPAPSANTFGVQDIMYVWTPASFTLEGSEYAVRGESIPTLDLGRMVVTPGVVSGNAWVNSGTTNHYIDFRKMFRQRWKTVWDHGSFMSLAMRDHLEVLYTTQQGFWITFDDELSYTSATLEPADNSGNYYLPPTYPIAYFSEVDSTGRLVHQEGMYYLYLDGTPIDYTTHTWSIDYITGLVYFPTAIDPTIHTVTMSYLWRLYVRIAEVGLYAADIAQNIYTGTVIFEQLTDPVAVDRFDNILVTTEPGLDCLVVDTGGYLGGGGGGGTGGTDDPPCGTKTVLTGVQSSATLTDYPEFTREYDFTGSSIPTTDWVTGVGMHMLLARIDQNHTDSVTVDAQLRRLTGSSSGYKTAQSATNITCAYTDYAPSFASFGNANTILSDILFGAWTPALINGGLRSKIHAKYTGTTVNHSTCWSITATAHGQTITDTVSYLWAPPGSATTNGTFTYAPDAGEGSPWIANASSSGYVEFTFTYIGPGQAPPYIVVAFDLDAHATARNIAIDGCTGSANNYIGYPETDTQTTSTINGHLTYSNDYRAHPTLNTQILVTGGVATYTVQGTATATSTGFYTGLGAGFENNYLVTATNTFVATVLAGSEIFSYTLDVYHMPPGPTPATVYSAATVGTGWTNNTVNGINGGLAVGPYINTSTGSPALVMRNIAIDSYIADAAHIVGIQIDFDARKMANAAETAIFYLRVNGVDSATTRTTGIAYNTFTHYRLGGMDDRWGYEAADSLSGAPVPSLTGASIKSNKLAVCMIGTTGNVINAEIKNIKITVWYVGVFAGCAIVEPGFGISTFDPTGTSGSVTTGIGVEGVGGSMADPTSTDVGGGI